MSTDDIHDWFEFAVTIESYGRELRRLFRCKVCAALVEGDQRAAHRFWHLSSREVDQ